MAGKKKILFGLLGGVVAALLVCLCLFGDTFARYTSSGTSGTPVSVALWDVNSVSSTLSIVAMSPSHEKYEENKVRQNVTEDWVDGFELRNDGDVDAEVTLSMGGLTMGIGNYSNDGYHGWGVGWTTSESTTKGYQYITDCMLRIDDNAYSGSTTDTAGIATFSDKFLEILDDYDVLSVLFGVKDSSSGIVTDLDGPFKIEAGDSATVCMKVAWTSVLQREGDELPDVPDGQEDWESWEEFSDAVDTIISACVYSISFTTSWTAVQASVV